MYRKVLMLTLFCSLFLFCSKNDGSQQNQSQEQTAKTEDVIIEELPAVCIWDKGSVRQEPNKDGKWISSMALGEKVTWLGETSIDSSDKNVEYHKIKLSDGTEGWASTYVVEIDAKPAVILKVVSLYKRPDYLTVTEKKLQEMEIIALKKSENGWLEVVGQKKQTQGWIQNENISQSDIDIAVGLLASKAISEKNEEVKTKRINEIIDNPAFQSSVFIPSLKDLISKEPIESSDEVDIQETPQADKEKIKSREARVRRVKKPQEKADKEDKSLEQKGTD